MNAGAPPITAFLSYSHADDAEFALVEPLRNKLMAFVRAKSGRDLNVFVDRESIGWGEDWRAKISSSVENATIFIPLLSANYLDSEPCREEFLAFHSKAEATGVAELLLPILIFKSPLFGADSPDEVAQIAESLQYKCIEDPMLEGYQSPQWLKCTKDLAESLLQALASAENALSTAAEQPPAATSSVSGNEEGDDPDEADGSGLAELMTIMEAAIDRMVEATEGLTPALDALGAVPDQVGALPDEPTAKQVTMWTIRLADGFKEPSKNLEAHGKELFDATKSLDETLIQLKKLIDSFDNAPEFTEGLTEGRQSVINGFGDLREIASTMDELMTEMRPAEAMSVPLRKSLQPARRGVTSVRDSLRLIESWKEQ